MSTYAFLGAGEFETWHSDIDRALLEGRAGRALVFATAAAPEGDDVYGGWVTKGVEHYRSLGVAVAAPALRTAADAHDPAMVEELDDTALVFFSGGNPAYLASVLAGSPVLAPAAGAHRRRPDRLRGLLRGGGVPVRPDVRLGHRRSRAHLGARARFLPAGALRPALGHGRHLDPRRPRVHPGRGARPTGT